MNYNGCIGNFGYLQKGNMATIDPLHMEKILNCTYKECMENAVSTASIEKIVISLRTEMESFV